MKAFFLVLILAAAVLLGLKGNLAYKKKQIEKRAKNMAMTLPSMRFKTKTNDVDVSVKYLL